MKKKRQKPENNSFFLKNQTRVVLGTSFSLINLCSNMLQTKYYYILSSQYILPYLLWKKKNQNHV